MRWHAYLPVLSLACLAAASLCCASSRLPACLPCPASGVLSSRASPPLSPFLLPSPILPLFPPRCRTPYPGGAPANVAAGVARLGAGALFISAIGKDDLGDQFVSLLQGRGTARQLACCAVSATQLPWCSSMVPAMSEALHHATACCHPMHPNAHRICNPANAPPACRAGGGHQRGAARGAPHPRHPGHTQPRGRPRVCRVWKGGCRWDGERAGVWQWRMVRWGCWAAGCGCC